MSQLSITYPMTVATAGMLAYGEEVEVRSFASEESAVTETFFGTFVQQGTTKQGWKNPTGGYVVGPLVWDSNVAWHQISASGVFGGAPGNILFEGKMFVLTASAASAGDRGYVLCSGTAHNVGMIQNSYSAGVTRDTSACIEYLEDAKANDLALVSVDMHQIQKL